MAWPWQSTLASVYLSVYPVHSVQISFLQRCTGDGAQGSAPKSQVIFYVGFIFSCRLQVRSILPNVGSCLNQFFFIFSAPTSSSRVTKQKTYISTQVWWWAHKWVCGHDHMCVVRTTCVWWSQHTCGHDHTYAWWYLCGHYPTSVDINKHYPTLENNFPSVCMSRKNVTLYLS